MEYPGAVPPDREWLHTSFGLRLHVCEWGAEGLEPLVLTHGFYDHARSFDVLAPLLAERYRVIALDARGHGDSDWPACYAWQADVLDLIGLLHHIGRPVHLVGHSRGGGLVLDAACQAPQLVRRAVVLDGFGPPPEGFRPGPPEEVAAPPQLLARYLDWSHATARRASFRPSPSLEALAERRRLQNPRLSLDWLVYFAHHGARRVEEGWVWKVDPLAARGFGPFRPEWIAPGWWRLEAPLLAVIGSEPDTWGPLPEALLAERLSHVPQLERAVVRDAGHFMHVEQPGATARLVLDFLEEAT